MAGETSTSERLKALNVSLVADMLKRLTSDQLVLAGVKPLQPDGATVVGRARTLRFLPPRSDVAPPDPQLRRKAIDSVESFEVLVFEAGSLARNPIFGDMVALRAQKCGCAGLVTDGTVRDRDAIGEIGFPVFAKDVWPAPSPAPLVAWERDIAIHCAGVLVRPGDWIVADGDGVIVLPEVHADAVMAQADEALVREEFSKQLLDRGHALESCFPIPERLGPALEAWRNGAPLPTPEAVERIGE